ncbi:MAG: helix-turn-helix transcriptional regulator [Anaerocolumna jejuensis]
MFAISDIYQRFRFYIGNLPFQQVPKIFLYEISSNISRLFKQTTGLSLFDYINQYRINKDKEYLIQSDLTINPIAKKTGFDTPQYFSIVFRKATGMTPKEYRSHSN